MMTVIMKIRVIYFWSRFRSNRGIVFILSRICMEFTGFKQWLPALLSAVAQPFHFLIKSLLPQLLTSSCISTSVGRQTHPGSVISLFSHSQSLPAFLSTRTLYQALLSYAIESNITHLSVFFFFFPFMIYEVTDEPQSVWPSSPDKLPDKAEHGRICISARPGKSHTDISVPVVGGTARLAGSSPASWHLQNCMSLLIR